MTRFALVLLLGLPSSLLAQTLAPHAQEQTLTWPQVCTTTLLLCANEPPNCTTVPCLDTPYITITDPAPRLLWESLQPPSPTVAPTRIERATVAALFASSSVSMVPVWITAACTTAHTCHEVNPVMARLIGNGSVRAATVKAGLSFVSHYAIWRLPATTKKQKSLRLGAALGLLAINTFDAANDIRVLRRIERRRAGQ